MFNGQHIIDIYFKKIIITKITLKSPTNYEKFILKLFIQLNVPTFFINNLKFIIYSNRTIICICFFIKFLYNQILNFRYIYVPFSSTIHLLTQNCILFKMEQSFKYFKLVHAKTVYVTFC